MRVSHDNNKLVKHKVTEYADRGNFHPVPATESKAHFVPSCFGYINMSYGSRLLAQEGWYYPGYIFAKSINTQKKERGQYPPEQTRSIKNLFYEEKYSFICGTQRAIPNGQDSTILPARVANHSTGFGWSCPLIELAIVIYHEKSMLRDNPSRYWQFSKHIGSPGLLITQLR